MAAANIAIVRRALDAWSRRDLEQAATLTAPDLEIVPAFASAVEGKTFRGPNATADFFQSVDAFFEDFSTEPEEFWTVDDDRVLVLGRVRALGRGSGVKIDQQWGSLWSLEEGRITQIRTFFDRNAALAAAGLQK